MVMRGWKAWKKRINLRYWGIFWSDWPIGEMEMNLVMLKTRAKMITGIMRRIVIVLVVCFLVFS